MKKLNFVEMIMAQVAAGREVVGTIAFNKVDKKQYTCKKCKVRYRVPNFQRTSMLVINFIIFISAILSLYIAYRRI